MPLPFVPATIAPAITRRLRQAAAGWLHRLQRPQLPHLATLPELPLGAWLPRACALCDRVIGPARAGLCRHCRIALPGRLASRCALCGLRIPAAKDCINCLYDPPGFDHVRVLADYAAPLDRLVTAMKFGGQIALARALGLELALRWHAFEIARPAALPPIGCLVPIPLSAPRWRERGFNQAGVIARSLGREVGLPVRTLLERQRDTTPQSRLPLSDRRINLVDTFAMRPRRGTPAHVAIVDDVMTSGATLEAAAAVLRHAGARWITVVVAARTP